MKKIPCLFERDFADRRRPVLLRTVTPGCEWVLNGEGTASRKRDGTACMVRGGKLFKRYDAKHGKKPPPDFLPCQDPDPVTGHWPGWIPVVESDPSNKWHMDAWNEYHPSAALLHGTYELCGPKFQGNPEGLTGHVFFLHGSELLAPPRDFDGIRDFLAANIMEGIVFAHPDGRMCKIRRGDYGMQWPVKAGSEAA